MKKLILALLLSASVATAQEYTGPTAPSIGDGELRSSQKINKILNDAKTGAAALQITGASSSNAGAPNFAVAQVTAATPAVSLVAARATRRGVTIRNSDATLSIYIGATGVNASTGLLLKAGESIAVDTTAAMFVFATSGSPVVQVLETYD